MFRCGLVNRAIPQNTGGIPQSKLFAKILSYDIFGGPDNQLRDQTRSLADKQLSKSSELLYCSHVAADSCVAFRFQNLPRTGHAVRLASASQFGCVTMKENSRRSVMSVSRGPPGRRVPPVAARVIAGDSGPSLGRRCGFLTSMIHCCNLDRNELTVAACKVQ